MKHTCRLFLFLIILVLVVGNVLCAEAATPRYYKGAKIQDFSFTTYDGEKVTLSEVLKEKDMVLINIWATWCGPCRSEFPYLQEAYSLYQDRVEVIALSCEPSDNASTLAAFARSYGLTFKIGQDPVDFLSAFGIYSIPTTFVVDRYGTICFVESGAQPDSGSFMRLFDYFLAEDYNQSVILDSIPPATSNVDAATDSALTEALGVTATNLQNGNVWPMTVMEKDGRLVVASSNADVNSSTSAVRVNVYAQAGDAIVVEFKTSTETIFDLLKLSVNGSTVKSFGGEHDWTTYAISVNSNGFYDVVLSYEKDSDGRSGYDAVWIDNVKVVSGDEAAAAINANPQYPRSDAYSLMVTNQNAREIEFTDENGILYSNFGPARYFIINEDQAYFSATVSPQGDLERGFFHCSYDYSLTPLKDSMTDDGYKTIGGVHSIYTTGVPYTYMLLYSDIEATDVCCVVYFKDEDNVELFVSSNGIGSWQYVDHYAPVSGSDGQTNGNEQSQYIIQCLDQYNLPVVGAMVQVCNEDTCQVFISDENGICEFIDTAYPLEIHALRAPENYVIDTHETLVAPIDGGTVVLRFTKE